MFLLPWRSLAGVPHGQLLWQSHVAAVVAGPVCRNALRDYLK